MAKSVIGEKSVKDLSRLHRIFLLVLVSMGSSIIYTPAYLKNVFYDPLIKALHASNAQIGQLLAAYALTATICYLPSGIVADKVRVRTLSWVGFVGTAALTFVYAFLPSIAVLYIVFVGMGITSILIWWGVRFKLVRLISEENEYSRNIGISYGLYGAAGLVVGLVILWIVESLFAGNTVGGVRAMLIFLGVIIGLLGVLSYMFIPKFEGEIDPTKSSFDFGEVLDALKNPVVWLAAGCMFFVYFYYTGINYTTPYFKDVMGASLGVVSFVSIVRTYGVTLLSGPIFGTIAEKVGSPSKVIVGGSVVAVAGLVAFTVLPAKPASAFVAAGIMIVLGFLANGVFGVVSSQLTEGKVPLTIFGTATGLLSVIGFLPDSFSSIWFGAMIDAQGNDAYHGIFLILAGAAVIAALFAVALLVYVSRNKAKLENAQQEAAKAVAENVEEAVNA